MLVCHECHSHVRSDDPTCPFCGASISTGAAPRSTKLGTTALTAGLLLGCATEPTTADTGVDSTTAMSSSGTTSDVSTDDGTTAGTDTGDSTTEGDSGTDWAEEAAYGVPETPCDDLGPEAVMVGDNAIMVDMDFSFVWQTCGGASTASLYAFTAPADGDYEFAVIDADFTPVFSLIGFFCEPLEELGCALPPETITRTLTADETVHIAVDSADVAVDGLANLTITPL